MIILAWKALTGKTLAFRELEAPASAGLAILLPFHHSGIPGKEPAVPQTGVISLVNLAKRPGKTVATGAGLTIGPTAVDTDKYIEFILTGSNHKGLPYRKNMLSLGEILNQFFAVYRYFSASVPYIHPGYRSLSAASSYTKILSHLT